MPHGDLHRVEFLGGFGVVGEEAQCGKLDGVGSGTAILTVRLYACAHDVRLRGGRGVQGPPVPTLGEAYDQSDAAIGVGARGGRILLGVLRPCYVTVPQHVSEVPRSLTRDHPEALGERLDVGALVGGEGPQTLVIETRTSRRLDYAVGSSVGASNATNDRSFACTRSNPPRGGRRRWDR